MRARTSGATSPEKLSQRFGNRSVAPPITDSTSDTQTPWPHERPTSSSLPAPTYCAWMGSSACMTPMRPMNTVM